MDMPQEPVLQTGTKNKTVHLFSSLNRSRAVREKQGMFAMEGFRLVRDAALSGIRLKALLLTERAAAQYAEELLAAAPGTHMLLLSEKLAAEIADTETAQGVFAAAWQKPETQFAPKQGSRYMLLHHVQDPSNLGAVLRTADALGTDGIFLYQCCDLYNPKAVRGSMGAVFRIPVQRLSDMDGFFAHCRTAGVQTCAAVVDRDAEQLGRAELSGSVCVLVGNEGNGLPRAVSDACDRRLTIPMMPGSNSLNAAMAAGLFLWEMRR